MTSHIRTRRRHVDLQSSVSRTTVAEAIPNDPNENLALAIEYVAPDDLTGPRRRLRKTASRHGAALRASIANFGFIDPILVDGDRRIICGAARWQAAKDLELEEVPVICAAHLSHEQMRLYAIAEQRIGELSEWDSEMLKLEFTELAALDLSLDLNLELSGFTTSEIDDFLVEGNKPESDDPPRFTHLPVCERGELWQLDEHRLYCGDAREEQSYEVLMGEDRAQIVFCDPPFNLPMATISGQDREEFAMASGEMTSAEFTTLLHTSFVLMARYSVDGAIHFQCMDWRHQREMLDAGEAIYSDLKNLIIWDKQTGGQGSFYRSQHELIFAWKVGSAPHINNFKLGETGRYRTNIWACRGNNSFHANRDEELAMHATVKPVALIADALRDCSHRGGIVLDAFGGSGSTLLAAEHTGRRARLIEFKPRYCDATIERWQSKTGRDAIHVETGQSWFERADDLGIDVHATDDAGAREAR